MSSIFAPYGPAVSTSSPAASEKWRDGRRLDLFLEAPNLVGGTNSLWHRWFSNGWYYWKSLGTVPLNLK